MGTVRVESVDGRIMIDVVFSRDLKVYVAEVVDMLVLVDREFSLIIHGLTSGLAKTLKEALELYLKVKGEEDV